MLFTSVHLRSHLFTVVSAHCPLSFIAHLFPACQNLFTAKEVGAEGEESGVENKENHGTNEDEGYS